MSVAARFSFLDNGHCRRAPGCPWKSQGTDEFDLHGCPGLLTHTFPCPCRDACSTGQVVRVTNVRRESNRWPEFSASATRLSLARVAGIPMRPGDQIIGALCLYFAEPRDLSDEDIAVAGVLANAATSCVVNASKLLQQEQPSEQLRAALESRLIIEQAKGTTTQQQTCQLIRPTSSRAGTPETTTPVCGEPPKQSLPWDSRPEPMRPSVCSSGAALNLRGPCPIPPGPSN